jgi:hypothetical protein
VHAFAGIGKFGGPDLSQMEPPAALVRTGWSVQGRRIILPAQRFTLFYVGAVSRDEPDFQRFEIIAKLAAAT